MPSLKKCLSERNLKAYHDAVTYRSNVMRLIAAGHIHKDSVLVLPNGENTTLYNVEIDITAFSAEYRLLQLAKVILFRAEQVEIFSDILKKKEIDSLEYRLPFSQVMLELTNPVKIESCDATRSIVGFLFEQNEISKEDYLQDVEMVHKADRLMGFSETIVLDIDWSLSDVVTVNCVKAIYDNLDTEDIKWTSQHANKIETLDKCDESLLSWKLKCRNLAIACIGYINCENIYLHKEGEVSDAINAKRERKGKSKLEPYYVCRIRGVQYDSEGYEKGVGVKHGIRYDVRGHFRHLTNGKTIWVRPHQRGLQNELYVPKTYLVDKKVQ